MKSILTGILLLLFSYTIGQTNLSSAEYYIDHDPGYGNATPIAISGDTAFINEILSNALGLGYHTLYMRVKDNLGNWGMDEAVPFKIREQWALQEFYQIDYVEYFINHDPGYGNATEINVLSGDTILISEIISNELSPGFNTLFIRSRNANNQWGIDDSFTFYVQANYNAYQGNPDPIVGFEYFIDDDPGNGNGIYISIEPGDTVQIHEWLPSQSLTDGIHQLSIRMLSDSGIWGLTDWTEFEYLNCTGTPVSVSGDEEFCEENTIELSLPISFDFWYWNIHQYSNIIETGDPGMYYGSVYDSVSNTCALSDTLILEMLTAPDASFTFTSSFNSINVVGSGVGQNLFWQLNDEYSTTQESFSYTFLTDGWQTICLEASNLCGTEEVCDSVLLCGSYETPPYWYLDADGDGYGSENDSTRACEVPFGYADNLLDCDDDDESIYPGAPEVPDDDIDQNCDGDDLVTGVNEIDENTYHFYPNPANEEVYLKFSISFSGSIILFDAAGKMVFESKYENETEVLINIKNINPGLYYLEISNKDDRSIEKLIIQ